MRRVKIAIPALVAVWEPSRAHPKYGDSFVKQSCRYQCAAVYASTRRMRALPPPATEGRCKRTRTATFLNVSLEVSHKRSLAWLLLMEESTAAKSKVSISRRRKVRER